MCLCLITVIKIIKNSFKTQIYNDINLGKIKIKKENGVPSWKTRMPCKCSKTGCFETLTPNQDTQNGINEPFLFIFYFIF